MNRMKIRIFCGIVYAVLAMAGVFSFHSATAANGPVQEQTRVAVPAALTPALFAVSSNCRQCHDALTDEDGEDISFVHHWETTMMRFSFLDPFWQAKVRSETLRIPGHAQAIEEKCVRCHAPMASVQALADGQAVSIFGDGFASVQNQYHEIAMGGVGCTLCHQVTEPMSGEDSFSGHFNISASRLAWGPFAPKSARTMEQRAGYLPTQASHLGTSEFCASCHELSTDYVDVNGNIVSTPQTLFPEQAPYKEWLESTFSDDQIQCQDCHMNRAAATKITTTPKQVPDRDGVQRHTFFTENTAMLDIVQSAALDEGLDIPDLNEAVENGKDYLYEAGEIQIEQVVWEKNTLTVTVRVVNLAGHKLPTSIPLRRMFIHFAVYDKDGQVLFSSGDVDSQGRIIGVTADTLPLSYEPHYDIIEFEDQVQVYEGIMGTVENEVTYTLLRASHYIKDNRILPRGFDKTAADSKVLPAGGAMNDDNFTGGEDRITYRIENISGGTVIIQAELKDQTLSYPAIMDLFSDIEKDPQGPIAFFKEKYEEQDRVFEIIHSDTQEIHRTVSP